jgi:hypothetical protein
MQMKRVLAVTLVVGCVVSLAWVGGALFAGSKAQAEGTGTQRWEYMVVRMLSNTMWIDLYDPALSHTIKSDCIGSRYIEESHDAQLVLDGAGDDGWELVTASVDGAGSYIRYVEFIFKRPLL